MRRAGGQQKNLPDFSGKFFEIHLVAA